MVIDFDTIPKTDGKVKMCTIYKDLDKVSPKDDFSLHHIIVLVYSIAWNCRFSFMDDNSDNQYPVDIMTRRRPP